MSGLPTHMRNRWLNRAEPAPGSGILCWHVLLNGYPQARVAATEAQESLEGFSGLHMTPQKWLHMTTLVVGSTDEITRGQMSIMLAEVQRQLDIVAPIPVTMGKVLYHPEAIALSIQPAEVLRPIFDAARSATRKAAGHLGADDESFRSSIPHMTIAYSTAEQPAGPIVAALGTSIRERQVLLDSLTLVIQWGAERHWDWELVGTAYLRESGQVT